MAAGQQTWPVLRLEFEAVVGQNLKQGIKVEKQYQLGTVQNEGPGGGEGNIHPAGHAGSIGELLHRLPEQQVKPEPGERLVQQWEDQWQGFLRAMESPRSVGEKPPLAEGSAPWSDVQAFLASFEQVAEACLWPQGEWVVQLRPALRGEAGEVFSGLEARDQEDYGKVKAALLQREALRRETIRQRFRSFCYREAEGPRAVYGRLQELCHGWLKAERQTKEQILEELVLEQFLAVLPTEVQNWVRGHRLESCAQTVALAEDYYLGRQSKSERPEQQVTVERVHFSGDEQALLAREQNRLFREADEGVAASWSKNCQGEDPASVDEKDQTEGAYEEGTKWVQTGSPEEEGPQCGEAEEPSRCWLGSNEHQKKSPVEKGGDTGDYEGREPLVRTSSQQRTQMMRTEIMDVLGDGSFPDNSEIIEFQVTHAGGLPYKCLDCGQSFNYRNSLVRHQRIHTGEKPYKCPDCGRCFRQRSCLTIHQRIHTGEKEYQCPDCGKSFRVKSHLLRHSVVHREEMGTKPFTCVECGKGFSWNANLITHRKTHTGVKPFACGECGKRFYSNVRLVSHRRVHAMRNLHPCSDCGKSFCDNTGLSRHRKIHTGEKPHVCVDCGKTFDQNSSLILHQRIHTEAKPFLCADCGENFRSKLELQKHYIVHAEKKSHQRAIPSCEKTDGKWPVSQE